MIASLLRGGFRFDNNHMPSINLYLRRVIRDAKGRLSEETRGVLIKEWHSREIAQCPMRWVEEPLAPKPGAALPPPKPGAAPAKPNPPVKPPR